jgi:hypothetical protein
MLCASGSTFIQFARYRKNPNTTGSHDSAEAVAKWNRMIVDETRYFNENLAGGKWKYMMMVGGSTSIREGHPFYQLPKLEEKSSEPASTAAPVEPTLCRKVLGAADFARKFDAPGASWQIIKGLGWGGRAVSLNRMTAESHWADLDRAPRLEYDVRLERPASSFDVLVHMLPDFRLNPSVKLRLAASVGELPPQFVEVPLSGATGGAIDQRGIRKDAILANRVTVRFSFHTTRGDLHTVKVWTPDPGVILDQIEIRAAE